MPPLPPSVYDSQELKFIKKKEDAKAKQAAKAAQLAAKAAQLAAKAAQLAELEKAVKMIEESISSPPLPVDMEQLQNSAQKWAEMKSGAIVDMPYPIPYPQTASGYGYGLDGTSYYKERQLSEDRRRRAYNLVMNACDRHCYGPYGPSFDPSLILNLVVEFADRETRVLSDETRKIYGEQLQEARQVASLYRQQALQVQSEVADLRKELAESKRYRALPITVVYQGRRFIDD